MKTNEIMIGDWVYNKHHKKNIQITPYDFFTHGHLPSGSQYFIGEPEPVSGRDLEPIPLTPEILEKNGFYFGYTTNEMDLASNTIAQLSQEDKGWVWDEGDGAIKVIFPNESDGGMITIDDQSFDRHLTMVFCENIFVHELQHALRLCGIEKEIVL